MATKIKFTNDVTKGEEEAQGSDGRFNVSSRSDSRGYYNARDEGRLFTVTYEMTDPVAGEYVAYWRNADPNRQLVIVHVDIACLLAARVKLNFVTGVASAGTELTPVNSNKASSNDAADDAVVMAMKGGAAATGIGGLTADGEISFIGVGAADTGEFHVEELVRLGQNDAIGIEVDEIASTGDVWGTIVGYYE